MCCCRCAGTDTCGAAQCGVSRIMPAPGLFCHTVTISISGMRKHIYRQIPTISQGPQMQADMNVLGNTV